jgi:hypothetical protein
MKIFFKVYNDLTETKKTLKFKEKHEVNPTPVKPGKSKLKNFTPKDKRLEIDFYTDDQSFRINYFRIRKNCPGKLKEVHFRESGKRNWKLIMIWKELPEVRIEIEPPPPANVDVGVKE